MTNEEENKLLTNSNILFEGDILIRKPTEGSQSSAIFEKRIWPDAKIPYQISNTFSNLLLFIIYFFTEIQFQHIL